MINKDKISNAIETFQREADLMFNHSSDKPVTERDLHYLCKLIYETLGDLEKELKK